MPRGARLLSVELNSGAGPTANGPLSMLAVQRTLFVKVSGRIVAAHCFHCGERWARSRPSALSIVASIWPLRSTVPFVLQRTPPFVWEATNAAVISLVGRCTHAHNNYARKCRVQSAWLLSFHVFPFRAHRMEQSTELCSAARASELLRVKLFSPLGSSSQAGHASSEQDFKCLPESKRRAFKFVNYLITS